MIDGDRELKRTIDLAEQIRKDEELRRQALGDDHIRKHLELVESAEKLRKLTEPSQTLTESLKPLRDALRGGEEIRKLTQQVQDAIGVSPRLTDIIRSTTMPSFPEMPKIRSMGDHVQELIHAQAESAEASTARRAVLHLEAEIREFEAELDDESQGVGVQLVAFGQTTVVHVTLIDHIQPNLIVFIGKLDETGAPVKLIQHMSQLSFMLVRVPRLDPETPRRPIGFTTTEEDA
jgi:hypothetical protein